jgi:hypothetical protein
MDLLRAHADGGDGYEHATAKGAAHRVNLNYVLKRSLSSDAGDRDFTDGAERMGAVATHPHVAVIAAGKSENLDLPAAVRELRRKLGIQHLLCEGGPMLYGTLARADLIDEKFLTVAPIEIGQMVPPQQERLPHEQHVGALVRPNVFGGPGFTRETMTRYRRFVADQVRSWGETIPARLAPSARRGDGKVASSRDPLRCTALAIGWQALLSIGVAKLCCGLAAEDLAAKSHKSRCRSRRRDA